MKYFETSLMPHANFLGENINYAKERYEFANDFCSDKIVLDAGCGTGYGTYELSKKAQKVYGLDQNQKAISYAQKKYQNRKIKFQVGNLEKIRFKQDYFDLICAFEVIEHINDYQATIKEFYRILKPGGILLISTPNKAVYSPYSKKPFYPYHLHEYYLDDFKNILKQFRRKEILVQSGKNIFFPKWHPKSIVKTIYANLPLNLKIIILRSFLKFKLIRKKSKEDILKVRQGNLTKARIFVAICKKDEIYN